MRVKSAEPPVLQNQPIPTTGVKRVEQIQKYQLMNSRTEASEQAQVCDTTHNFLLSLIV
jgi:hypothetical protein